MTGILRWISAALPRTMRRPWPGFTSTRGGWPTAGWCPIPGLDGLDYGRRAARFSVTNCKKALPRRTSSSRQSAFLGFLTLDGCRDSDVDAQATGEIWGIYLAPQAWRRGHRHPPLPARGADPGIAGAMGEIQAVGVGRQHRRTALLTRPWASGRTARQRCSTWALPWKPCATAR